MFFLFKFCFYFMVSFIILSISFQDKPIFEKIYNVTLPYKSKILIAIKKNIQLNNINTANQHPIKKVFSKNELKSIKKSIKANIDDFTAEETNFLEKTIRDYQK